MSDLTAQRTLVKSPPELWSEVSEVESLARRLGEFGDIRITKLEPEHTVAWEGEHASGTVALEASGWGTKVTLSVAIAEPGPPPAAEPEPAEKSTPEPELEPSTAELAAIEFTSRQAASEGAPAQADPAPVDEPAASPPPTRARGGFFSRLFRRRHPAPEPTASPEPAAAPPEPPAAAVSAPPPAPVPPEPESIVERPVAAESQPGSTAIGEQRAREVLDGALDDLGAAHHRPFSRG